MTNTSYIRGYYHTITNHTLYVHRGTSSTVYSYACPEQTRQDRYQETLEGAGDKGQRIKKVTKVNESKQFMKGGLQEEPVEYGVLMPCPQLTQQAASIGTSPMPLKCFHLSLIPIFFLLCCQARAYLDLLSYSSSFQCMCPSHILLL